MNTHTQTELHLSAKGTSEFQSNTCLGLSCSGAREGEQTTAYRRANEYIFTVKVTSQLMAHVATHVGGGGGDLCQTEAHLRVDFSHLRSFVAVQMTALLLSFTLRHFAIRWF